VIGGLSLQVSLGRATLHRRVDRDGLTGPLAQTRQRRVVDAHL
jgi:hypothetical protein